MVSLKKIAVAIIIFIILQAYFNAADDAANKALQIEVRIQDITPTGGIIVELYNPTNYTYEVEQFHILLIQDNETLITVMLEKPVTLFPNETVSVELKPVAGIVGMLKSLNSIILNKQMQIKMYMKVKPSIDSIPLPSATIEYKIKYKNNN